MKREGYLINGKRIDVYIPDKVNYEALENLYDCCNELFNEPDCFYTKEDIANLKKDSKNTFWRKGERR